MEGLPERYTPEDIEKVVRDIDHRYEVEASASRIAKFDGLPHDVHSQGAVIS